MIDGMGPQPGDDLRAPAGKRGAWWVVCGPGPNQVECLRCGDVRTLPLPLELKTFTRLLRDIERQHSRCKEK